MKPAASDLLPDHFERPRREADRPAGDADSLPAETHAAAGASRRCDGVVIGGFAGFSDAGEPLVDFPGNPCFGAVAARSIVPLEKLTDGCEAALTFVEGDARRPLIVGVLQQSALELALESRQELAANVDGERLELTAAKEIVLRCGEASITLTKAGKILLKGTYLLSRSSGVNRVKGGSVQIN